MNEHLKTPKLTMRRLRAIEEALCARLAGAMEAEDISRADYEGALDWAEAKIERLKARMAS